LSLFFKVAKIRKPTKLKLRNLHKKILPKVSKIYTETN
jgi:hypothetical protein